ncbi:MAG: hypothetical protein Q8S84_06250 [bacterium]|nr:hypothetical protein [bacterium]
MLKVLINSSGLNSFVFSHCLLIHKSQDKELIFELIFQTIIHNQSSKFILFNNLSHKISFMFSFSEELKEIFFNFKSK